jgi:hypothetical protein
MGPVRGYAQSNARQQAGESTLKQLELASSAILTELRTGRKLSKYRPLEIADWGVGLTTLIPDVLIPE